jgi:hypothetical protein
MDHDQDTPPFDVQDNVNQTPDLTAEQTMESAGNPVCYHQNCPVCGRNLRIRVRLLGRRVYCQHCGGGFVASDAATSGGTLPVADRPQSAIVDELIERAAVMLGHSGE